MMNYTKALRLPKDAIADLLSNSEALLSEGFRVCDPVGCPSTTDWETVEVQSKDYYQTPVCLAIALGKIVGWKSRHIKR